VSDVFQSALNVLLIEDDKELAGFVQQGLEDESCIVKVCHDGGSGLRQAEIHAFDIILLDVMLPVLNGFEVTKRLRLQNLRTPILLLTARDAPEDIVKGLDAGADDCLADHDYGRLLDQPACTGSH
jgi:two-component system, OmpR family, copper resistance phosphate regulon response regulator CusR